MINQPRRMEDEWDQSAREADRDLMTTQRERFGEPSDEEVERAWIESRLALTAAERLAEARDTYPELVKLPDPAEQARAFRCIEIEWHEQELERLKAEELADVPEVKAPF